jgi:hypothetical protein
MYIYVYTYIIVPILKLMGSSFFLCGESGVGLYTYIYVFIHIYIYACICIYLYIYMFIYMYVELGAGLYGCLYI